MKYLNLQLDIGNQFKKPTASISKEKKKGTVRRRNEA